MTDIELNEAFSALIGQFAGHHPHIKDIMDRAKMGELSFNEALTQMAMYVQAQPELQGAIEEVVQRIPSQGLQIFGEGMEAPSEVMQTEKDRCSRLNPLFEAALGERMQFDGDAPELRTGPMPEGVAPAVSVKTTARNPVAVGRMLTTASRKVKREVKAHEAERRKAIEAIEAGEDVLQLMGKHGQLVKREDVGDTELMIRGSAGTDHPEYRRGSVPAPVKVRRPSGSSLAKMSDKDARVNAYKFFSSTQGRRTVLPVIRGMVATELQGKGWEVKERDHNPKDVKTVVVLAHHKWSAAITGSGASQAAFSFVDVAGKSLARNLLNQLSDQECRPVNLEIISVDTVDVRSVGWAARVVVGG